MHELGKEFRFDAAHTLNRTVAAGPSRRIHGHSYRAEVVLRGEPDPATGMIMDMGLLERAIEDTRTALDHRFLDEIAEMGPATMENISAWIWRQLSPRLPNLCRVTVKRDSDGGACTYYGPQAR